MIIILTGPSGVGKSEVAASIVCHQYFKRMVNIESDFFSLKKPFDWFDKETMKYVYEAISNMIHFHLGRNEPSFVTKEAGSGLNI